MIIIPLEWIALEEYRAQNWTLKKKRFRETATVRERYWTSKLRALWPTGWNSMVPGKPVGHTSIHSLRQESLSQEDKQEWVSRWRANPSTTIKEIEKLDKPTIRDVLYFAQTKIPPASQNKGGISLVMQLIAILKKKREQPPKREYLKFKFVSNDARDLRLWSVLRLPEVYEKHPEPEKAAAMMISESFSTQLQAYLFNHTQEARDLDVSLASADELSDCCCRKCFVSLNEDDLNATGHVISVCTEKLKWPYLRTLTQRGKKFRIPMSLEKVFEELNAQCNSRRIHCLVHLKE
jgi:hypothetical protein